MFSPPWQVATFGAQAVNVSLTVNLTALGLDSTAVASLPAIPGVQAGAALPNGPAGPFELQPDSGLLMLIAAPGLRMAGLKS